MNRSLRHLLPGFLPGAALVFGIALLVGSAVVDWNGHASAAVGLSNRVQVVMVAADSASGSPATPTATTSPSATTTPGGVSHTVSLKPGQGFVFEPPTVTVENPDIRWTGSSLVPGPSTGMLRLPGMFFGVEDLPPPPPSGYVPTTFHPETGDGFAIQLITGAGDSYGEIWVSKISGGTLTFGWRYVPGRCGGSTAQVTATDRPHQEVHFDAHGELSRWHLITNSGSRFDFPAGIVFDGPVIAFGKHAPFNNNLHELFWSQETVLSFSSLDDVFLYDCTGQLVQHYVDTGNP